MRPLRLVTSAFGPYSGEQTLDFRELGDRTLFLIHGPTGSGKTTILDAICFAFYGECSGDEREPKRMRSDHADPSVLTEVTFDFRLGTEVYRVHRRPEQPRPKKRGTGTTMARSEATLTKRTGIGDDSIEGTVVASQWNSVTDAVVQLLGFESDQFRQVVMLPQGQFRRLLLANSKERQEILEVLFQTELYRRIEEALKKEARRIEKEIGDKKKRLAFVLEQADSESEKDIRQRHDDAMAGLVEVEKRRRDLQSREQDAQEKLNEGKRVLEKFTELQQARESLKTMESRVDAYADLQDDLGRARKAAPIIALEKALEGRAREANDAKETLKKAREAAKAVRKARDSATERLAAENERKPDRDEAHQNLVRLKDLADRVKELDEARGRLTESRERFATASARLQAAATDLEKCDNRIEQNKQALEDTEKIASKADMLHLQAQQARKVSEDLERLVTLSEEESLVRDSLGEVAVRFTTAKEELEEAIEQLAALEDAWMKGQAATLADELKAGEPCPVCGSTEHPSPAHSKDPLPSERSLKAKRNSVDGLRKSLDTIGAEKTGHEKRISEILAAASVLKESLGDQAGRERDDVEAEARRIKRALTQAQKAEKRLDELTGLADELRLQKIKAQEAYDSAQAVKDEAASRLQATQAEVTTRQEGIPEELADMPTLKREQQRAEKRVRKLNEALERAQEDLTKAGEELASCDAALAAAEDTAAKASQRVLIQREEFEHSVRAAGFPDRNAFVSARRTDAEINRMDKEIQVFHQDLNAARDRTKRAEQGIDGLVRPEVASLEEAAARIKKSLETALREEAALSEQEKLIRRLLSEHAKYSKDLTELEAEYAVYGRISEVANGTNSQGVTFQRFVLAALLDDVLMAATARLQIMSNRRYSLLRRHERSDRRTVGGLDLEVSDSYTGTNRPVSSLSGGESFLASLSLALGLSDVVQAYAGGIHLDTIFVDEGFGSLDPEALDLAFRALMDLQRDGRLVGIISHVPDLRERIDTRLEVTAHRQGSAARFVAS